MTAAVFIAFAIRLMLVLLFLPFSALDKLLNFRGAVAQARQMAPTQPLAVALILMGLLIEIFMSAAVLIGIADRAAALILAAYCAATAVLWKQFWTPGDFWSNADGKARGLFWDFWKNLSVAGGFLLVTFGVSAASVGDFFSAPLASSHPYAVANTSPP